LRQFLFYFIDGIQEGDKEKKERNKKKQK